MALLIFMLALIALNASRSKPSSKGEIEVEPLTSAQNSQTNQQSATDETKGNEIDEENADSKSGCGWIVGIVVLGMLMIGSAGSGGSGAMGNMGAGFGGIAIIGIVIVIAVVGAGSKNKK
jgi:hypothetical protein